jgi:hypothetical protein
MNKAEGAVSYAYIDLVLKCACEHTGLKVGHAGAVRGACACACALGRGEGPAGW